VNTVSYFVYEECKWHKCAPMTIARSAFSAVIGTDRKIYVMGGYHEGKNISHVERYNSHTDKWEILASMSEARSSHTALGMPDGIIYVFGGWVKAEKYDIKKNEWSISSDLTIGKSSLTAIPSSDCKSFYAIGGELTPGTCCN